MDVSKRGFELLEYMQGHWVGSMNLMGQDYDWMAFDDRAIAPSPVHGIFEGGTIGHLFTSFFVTNFNGARTIFARNGGMLNGIYRTRYFVLDKVDYGEDWAYYRLVDARGGQGIMWMELTFYGETLEFNSYTSRFGLTEPKLHMAFKGKRRALTDRQGKFFTQGGYVRTDLLDWLLSFPELSEKENAFTFTYLHPGGYFLTVVADMDADGFPSPGDISHPATKVVVSPKFNAEIEVKTLNVRN